MDWKEESNLSPAHQLMYVQRLWPGRHKLAHEIRTTLSRSNSWCHLSLEYKSPSVQFSSVTQSCPTLFDPLNRSSPGLPVHHQLLEFTQTHVHRVSDTIQPSHPLSSPSPPAPTPSQHQSLFQWVNSSHEVAKVLEFQLQHQSWVFFGRTDAEAETPILWPPDAKSWLIG